MERIKHAILGTSTLVISIAVQFVVLMAYIIIQTVQAVMKGTAASGEEVADSIIMHMQNGNTLIIVSALCAIINICIFILWFRQLQQHNKTEKMKWDICYIAELLLMGVGIQFGLSVVLTLLGAWQPGWFESYNEMMEQLGVDQGGGFVWIYAGVIAPISEELVFRGVAFAHFRKIAPWMYANVLQAMLFGIMHMNLIQGIYAFAIGMILGYVYHKSGDIRSSILLHMFVNLSAYLLQLIVPSEGEMSVFSMAGIFLISAGVIMLMISRIEKREIGKVEE